MMSRNKKYGIAMLVTFLLSVANTVVAFVIGAWKLPGIIIEPSMFFVVTQIILIVAFIWEMVFWGTE